MTVGEYLRSLVFSIDIPDNVIERCVNSPREVNLTALDASDEAFPDTDTDNFQVRLDYASSTLYYSVIAIFTGGGYSERVGDVSVTKNGYTITQSDRNRFKEMADALRIKHGFAPLSDTTESGMFDMGYAKYKRR